MALREKRNPRNVVESEEENESGACGGNDPPMSLSAAEAILGSYFDESVDNLSMEVHLGDDNSRHPSEISSVSYQNLLEDSEPLTNTRSRRASDDSVESYPLDYPDGELPPDDMETFEACDLPLSEHFPMGSLQGRDNYKIRPLSDTTPSSRPSVKLKEDSVKLRENNHEKNTSQAGKSEELSTKNRNSLEIRNNIPIVGEVKDYDKQLNLDGNKIPAPNPKMIGLKQSPGLAHRVEQNKSDIACSDFSENSKPQCGEQVDVCSLPSVKAVGAKIKPKTNISRTSEAGIEVITPIPKNMNIENEYDYVKYARVQQGNSYVGMRLAYSSSNDSLNIKNTPGSINSSRETSPEKVLQMKMSDLDQSRVNEEALTEIPLNNSDCSEDKKAFTLSPENTECDSVEVESVTSEGENSPAGFPTVEDGLSSSQASDAEDIGDRLSLDRSPSKVLQNKQKASIDQQLRDEDEEYQGPPEMDAQAIMEDLKMKREALDMAIADIKTAIQRSKNLSLDASYNPDREPEDVPIWIKRDTPGQAVKQHDDSSRGKNGLENKQSNQLSNTGKPTPERDGNILNNSEGVDIHHSSDTQSKDKSNVEKECEEFIPDRETCHSSTEFNNNKIYDQNCDDLTNCSLPSESFELGSTGDSNRLKCVNDAIEMVSNRVVETLNSNKTDEIEIADKTSSSQTMLQPDVKQVKNDNNDINEFDTLAVSLANDISVCEEDQRSHEPCVIEEVIGEEKCLNVNSHNVNDYSLEAEEKKVCNFEKGVVLTADATAENDNEYEEKETHINEGEKKYCKEDGSRIVKDGQPIGYDSDDECEDAEGIRYTRRSKGKKYAPLQKDDSLEFGNYGRQKEVPASRSNGHVMHASSNGSVCNKHIASSIDYEEHHLHRSDPTLSSEESSDIDAHISSYTRPPNAESDTDEETDRLLHKQYQERDKHVEIPELNDASKLESSMQRDRQFSKAKEDKNKLTAIRDPDRPEVLIEGVLFRARYLGSTQLISEGQPSKAMRMMQAQEAVGRIKAPDGENQPSTDVDLFVSTEKIMVLNTDLQEIMMDHSLRTISYIADIGDILVIMARRRLITSPDDLLGRRRRQAKILCHVFESDEAQLIAQSIGQAFQVAYLEFLKANGIEDPGLLKEMDYQDVLNQQEIYGEELNLFANKDFHKEVIVPKAKNEPLGIVIVESGWGSMVPTVVLANMMPTGPAARCGQLNIGDQIISINGVSLVGLLLSACQTYIKASRTQTVVKLTVVPCPPVVEVLIKRPDVKYQLGFSVQNGVICSLLRGGIAERGGVRVGHRIIEINNQSVVAVPHEKIVTLLASSVGEIHMKTMPTSIFRLLTGQDVPHYL